MFHTALIKHQTRLSDPAASVAATVEWDICSHDRLYIALIVLNQQMIHLCSPLVIEIAKTDSLSPQLQLSQFVHSQVCPTVGFQTLGRRVAAQFFSEPWAPAQRI